MKNSYLGIRRALRAFRHKDDLQPWLDYFDMLETMVRRGYLELSPERDEAFITYPAIALLSGFCDAIPQLNDMKTDGERNAALYRLAGRLKTTAHRIRVYAEWLYANAREEPETRCRFALHFVSSEAPHDMILTICITDVRCWWFPLRRRESYNIIYY